MGNFIYKNILYFFAGALILLNFFAFLAPLLAELGFEGPARGIYWIYGFFCHQRPWRSIHLFDYQVAWCTRDTFIYIAMALSAILVHLKNIKPMKWYFVPIFVLPMALDGGIQMIAEIQGVTNGENEFFYASTNLVRSMTAALFGSGIGLWLFAHLKKSIEEELDGFRPVKKKFKFIRKVDINSFKWICVIMILSFLIYFGLVQIWNITSDKYKPSGLFDNERYFPGVNYEEGVERRGHSVN